MFYDVCLSSRRGKSRTGETVEACRPAMNDVVPESGAPRFIVGPVVVGGGLFSNARRPCEKTSLFGCSDLVRCAHGNNLTNLRPPPPRARYLSPRPFEITENTMPVCPLNTRTNPFPARFRTRVGTRGLKHPPPPTPPPPNGPVEILRYFSNASLSITAIP